MPGSTYAANLVMDMEPELASACSESERRSKAAKVVTVSEARSRWIREGQIKKKVRQDKCGKF